MKTVSLLLALFCGFAVCASDLGSPIGTWKTYDETTGAPKSLVSITEAGGILTGKVVQVFPKPGESPTPICDKCKGDKKGKPIVGMTILWDMSKHGEKWKGGDIMDPENGKTYDCSLVLEDGGKKLRVRGYLGFSLLGRSQVWDRQ